jgi:hypothetical protein
MTADDFQLINPAGESSSREEYLDAIGSGDIDYVRLTPVTRIAVRRSGESAALRYRAAFDLVAGDTHLTHAGWVTVLYEHRGGRWRVVWDQATAVPNDLALFLQSLAPPR